MIDDIIARLEGKPLDLYVMTHEHLDHVQGLFHASEDFNKTIQAKQAWLTGSADPDYYKTRKRGRKKQKIAALAAYDQAATPGSARPGRHRRSPTSCSPTTTRGRRRSAWTSCGQAHRPGHVRYVDRETDLQPLQPAKSATISLWAPEEDTADYYGRFKPMAAASGSARRSTSTTSTA